MTMTQRIHFFTTRIDMKTGGGSHRHCVSLIRLLRDMGYEVVVHSLFSTRNFPPSDIDPHVYEGEKYSYRKFQQFLADRMKQYESETALFFIYGQPLIFGAGRYRRNGRVPVAIYLDNYLYSMGETTSDAAHLSTIGRLVLFCKELPYRIKRTLYDRTVGLYYARAIDQYFAVSPYLKDAYIRFGFPKDRFVVEPHFFDSLPHTEHVERSVAQVSFLYSGRLTYDKGVDLFLYALAQLPQKNWCARIIGDGPQKTTLEALAIQLGIAPQVTFVPWLTPEELNHEYERADVFVHPTRWAEPFGRTIVEAMQHGLALIVPDRGGPSWVAQGASLLFQNGNRKALTHALQVMLDDSETRNTLRKVALNRAHDFAYSIGAPVFRERIEKILQ